jgi:hypothetical protein
MAPIGSPSVVPPLQGVVADVEHEEGRSVVWLHDEHDLGTRDTLAEVIRRRGTQESGDVVLALCCVDWKP